MQFCIETVGEMARKDTCISVVNGEKFGNSRESWTSVSAIYIYIYIYIYIFIYTCVF